MSSRNNNRGGEDGAPLSVTAFNYQQYSSLCERDYRGNKYIQDVLKKKFSM